MIYGLTKESGWTIDYVMNKMSYIQIVILSLASNEIYDDLENTEEIEEEKPKSKEELTSFFAGIFGGMG